MLGTLLFLLSINDMPAITTNITTLFADDSRSPATIQSDFHCLFQFNQSKCSVLHIGKGNLKNNYMMGHTPLQVVEKERDLGVVVSAGNTLCWEEKYEGMIGKAKQMTSWIIRNVLSRKPKKC